MELILYLFSALQALPEIIEKQIMSHMEVKTPKPKVPFLEPIVSEPSQSPEPIDAEVPDFGPPKDHSIMDEEEHIINQDEISEITSLPKVPLPFQPSPQTFNAKHPNPPFLTPNFPPPPPPPAPISEIPPKTTVGTITEITSEPESKIEELPLPLPINSRRIIVVQ